MAPVVPVFFLLLCLCFGLVFCLVTGDRNGPIHNSEYNSVERINWILLISFGMENTKQQQQKKGSTHGVVAVCASDSCHLLVCYPQVSPLFSDFEHNYFSRCPVGELLSAL